MAGRLDDALGFYQSSMRLRVQRQQVLASNIANADTPNYKSRDLNFAQVLQANLKTASGSAALAQTNPAHLAVGGSSQQPETQLRAASQNSLDGNTVDLDVERAAFAENALQYEASVTLANAQIKGLMTVLQG
jgi:flagellar basal-body rod protein FlgB